MQHTQQMNEEMRQCIAECLTCHSICVETAMHCLMMGGEHAEPEHQRILQDCAQICVTSADFMLRISHHHARVCGLCAEVCKVCAEACDRIAGGDQTMKQCAEICRRCAESCAKMAHAMG